MSAQPLKTVFLDYDTVSNGDLDLARLREAAGDLILYDSSETHIAERIRDADQYRARCIDRRRCASRRAQSGAARRRGHRCAAPGAPPDREPLLHGQIPNLLVTPHIAWAAREARQRCIDEMAANIRDFRSDGRRGRVV